MVEEILALKGQLFEIWYDTKVDRIKAINEALSMFKGNIKSLPVATSCPSQINKTLGQSVIMTSTPISGTPPYTYSFYKISPAATPVTTWLLGTETSGQSLNSYTYTPVIADVTNIYGKLKIGLIVFDTCAAGPQKEEEWCFVNVTIPCNPPIGNLVLS